MVYPILTKRQFQILEMIAAGASRHDIADKLCISRETVKVHTKNLLAKFGACSVRGGMENINTYLAAFGANGRGYHAHFSLIENITTKSADLCHTHVSGQSFGQIICGPIHEILIQVKTEGSIANLKINGVSPQLEHLSPRNVIAKLKAMYKQGDHFERHISYETTHDPHRPIDYLCTTIGSPVDKLVMRGNFLGGTPKNWQATRLRGLKLEDVTNDSDARFSVGDTYIEGRFQNLKSDDQFMIRWDPCV